MATGQIVSTPGALRAVSAEGVTGAELLQRHQAGDWGDLEESDRQENTLSGAEGFRILSLIEAGGLSAERLLKCIAKTFERRASQPILHSLPLPPPEWNFVFARLAKEAGITVNMTEAFDILVAFWKNLANIEFA